MRVSNQSTYDAIKYQLAKSVSDLVTANGVVSSGKRINKLSDDPVGLVQVLSLRQSLSNIDQLDRNVSTARTWLDGGETVLDSVKDLITDMKTLAVQMANGTVGPDERASAAIQVQGAIEQIESLANTQINGQYIFAGTKTDTKPFEITGSTVNYYGNDTPFSIKIGRTATVDVGQNGETVFGNDTTGIFRTLLNFKDALNSNDTSGISNAMDTLDDDLNTMISAVSDIGSKGVRLDVKEKILGDLKLTYTERKSSLEDADILAAIADLQSKETAYQAALSSSAKVMNVSLLDYLK